VIRKKDEKITMNYKCPVRKYEYKPRNKYLSHLHSSGFSSSLLGTLLVHFALACFGNSDSSSRSFFTLEDVAQKIVIAIRTRATVFTMAMFMTTTRTRTTVVMTTENIDIISDV
jgi:hypothetical protein